MDTYSKNQRPMYGDDNDGDNKVKAQQKADLESRYKKLREAHETQIADLDRGIAETEGRLQSERQDLTAGRGSASESSVRQLEDQLGHMQRERSEEQAQLESLEAKQELGNRCIDHAKVTQGPEGEVTITAPVGPPQPRMDYEKADRSDLDSQWPEKERLHSRGAGLGFECDCGIYYGSPELNQEFQNKGIEEDIRRQYENKRDDCELILTTETRAHEGTSNLKSIHYDLKVQYPDGTTRDVYSMTLTDGPKGVEVNDVRRGSAYEDPSWMKQPTKFQNGKSVAKPEKKAGEASRKKAPTFSGKQNDRKTPVSKQKLKDGVPKYQRNELDRPSPRKGRSL